MNPENTNETPTRRTLPEAAKPYRWKKGGPSPNPGGRPKTAHISEALRRALESGEAEQLASMLIALATGRKRGSAVQIAALREIADRTEGKPRQTVEVDAAFKSNIAERLERARKRHWQGVPFRFLAPQRLAFEKGLALRCWSWGALLIFATPPLVPRSRQ